MQLERARMDATIDAARSGQVPFAPGLAQGLYVDGMFLLQSGNSRRQILEENAFPGIMVLKKWSHLGRWRRQPPPPFGPP